MLFVSGMFKRSGACYLCPGYVRGVVRVVCERNV